MSAAAQNRQSRIIERYGMTPEFYREQIALGNRWCSDCKQFRTPEDLGSSKTRCLPCIRVRNASYIRKNSVELNAKRREYFRQNRAREIAKRRVHSLAGYGVTTQWYEDTIAAQAGGCALCGQRDECGRFLAVDHDHRCCNTKRACDKCRRGLLCSNCNRALERVETVPNWTGKALEYLRHHGSI